MASKQAMDAAQNIASWMRLKAHQFPSDGNVAEWSAIIDAAFAPTIAELVGLLREALEIKRHYAIKERAVEAKNYELANKHYQMILATEERARAAIEQYGGEA